MGLVRLGPNDGFSLKVYVSFLEHVLTSIVMTNIVTFITLFGLRVVFYPIEHQMIELSYNRLDFCLLNIAAGCHIYLESSDYNSIFFLTFSHFS